MAALQDIRQGMIEMCRSAKESWIFLWKKNTEKQMQMSENQEYSGSYDANSPQNIINNGKETTKYKKPAESAHTCKNIVCNSCNIRSPGKHRSIMKIEIIVIDNVIWNCTYIR